MDSLNNQFSYTPNPTNNNEPSITSTYTPITKRQAIYNNSSDISLTPSQLPPPRPLRRPTISEIYRGYGMELNSKAQAGLEKQQEKDRKDELKREKNESLQSLSMNPDGLFGRRGDFGQQMKTMLRHHFILQKRSFCSIFAFTVLAPLVVLLLMLGIQRSSDYSSKLDEVFRYLNLSLEELRTSSLIITDGNAPTWDLPGLYQCNSDRTGETLSLSDDSLSNLYEPSSNLGIVPTNSSDFIYNYTLQNPKVAQYAVSFHYPSSTQIEYTIWYNFTAAANSSADDASVSEISNNLDFGSKKVKPQTSIDSLKIDQYGNELLTIMRGIDEAIFAAQTDASDAKIDIKIKEFPNMLIQTTTPPENPNDKINGDVFRTSGMFLALPALLVFVIIAVLEVITEKELGQRGWMEMMQINLIMFNLFAWAMLSLGYFLTTICNRAPFVISLVTFIYQTIGTRYWATWYGKTQKGWIIGLFLPFFQFSELYTQIAEKSTDGASDLFNPFDPSATNATRLAKSFNWTSLSEYASNDGLGNKIIIDDNPALPKPYHALMFLAFQIVFYAMLVFIVDQGPGLLAKYRLKKKILDECERERHVIVDLNDSEKRDFTLDDMDSDLLEERNRAQDMNRRFGLRIVRLVKEFKGKFLSNQKERKVAVNALYLAIEEGQLFALLGQNGAGKTTTISMLAGHLVPTSGSAFIYDKNILTDMTLIRTSMGICPQDDLLFNDLTCREHIELFSGIKGLLCTDLSGGMKRRLSVVIASIGDPKIMILDEPTTGMDPVNRRKVWSFLSEYKKGRIILLTTHSMEEADLLGDRIAIMSRGKIRAIGNSTHLKTKRGNGYTIQIQTNQSNMVFTQIRVAKLVPLATLQDESAGSLIYQIPPEALSEISSLVDWLEENPDGMISGWGIMNTTLEDVFLNVSRACNDVDGSNRNSESEQNGPMRRKSVAASHFSVSSSLFGSKQYQWSSVGITDSLIQKYQTIVTSKSGFSEAQRPNSGITDVDDQILPIPSNSMLQKYQASVASNSRKSVSFVDDNSSSSEIQLQLSKLKCQTRDSSNIQTSTLSKAQSLNVVPIGLQQINDNNDKYTTDNKSENISLINSHRNLVVASRDNTQDLDINLNDLLPPQIRTIQIIISQNEFAETIIENNSGDTNNTSSGATCDRNNLPKQRYKDAQTGSYEEHETDKAAEDLSSSTDSRTNSKFSCGEEFVRQQQQNYSSPLSSSISRPHHQRNESIRILSLEESPQQNSSFSRPQIEMASSLQQSLRLENENENNENRQRVYFEGKEDDSRVKNEKESASFSLKEESSTQLRIIVTEE
ncbi:9156_t:CDS:10, partial [Ambispora gerdemannii]